MAVVIKNELNEVLLQEGFPFSPEELNSTRNIVEERKEQRLEFGAYDIQECRFDGIHLIICTAEVYETLTVASDDIMPHVSMLFMEQGDVRARIYGQKTPYRFSSLEHNIMYSPYREETAELRKQDGIQVLGMSFTPERFLELADSNGQTLGKMADRVANNKSVALAEKMNPRITPRMKTVLAEIRQCQFKGGLKKLFLQSKVMELLALQCDQVENDFGRGAVVHNINTRELEQLQHARYLLLQNLQEPPSLAELSRLCGLNEFKLKSGFKTVFDNTVFGYFNDHRLSMARELVLAGGKTLAEIADDAGYSSPQHFSSAFKKKYGVAPSKL
ncbi:helix-turn-helix transcriptional regulator [Chitinophaga oryzae]|uniref:Helix-turn-helix transcriptional regulator n=1 Tax=Chitinophaga oryzae TaxID=2725414 RepID=A0AAE7D922_9BACT|nr:AraC family transcriptional regulator [Chitinophaga oryzae]QJB32733.1 helix-turn-helix transcriptional regulator [Chitinophaga oryzae]QJB39185.1 helix-turn-helix transcriptional regulator [Chitinophaga oryzae]